MRKRIHIISDLLSIRHILLGMVYSGRPHAILRVTAAAMEDDDLIVLPGHRLGSTSEYSSGLGTFERRNYIFASIAGIRKVTCFHDDGDDDDDDDDDDKVMADNDGNEGRGDDKEGRENNNSNDNVKDTRSVMQVIALNGDSTCSTFMPGVGSQVTCKVMSMNPRFAKVAILCVERQPLKETFRGMIRVQDIRAMEKDKVEVYQSFRPGDIVKAEVISLGDSRNYYLSTGKNELGVVSAQSIAGATLIPISWCEMICPLTKAREFRKVAKPAGI